MNQAQAQNPANNTKTIHVTNNDLPLSCPTKEMETWNAHPRVYLDVSKTGEATCPYCSNHFVLDNS